MPATSPSDPDAVLLCQLPGMRASALLRLTERWSSPAAILRAQSSELRAAGLPPALVARIVAAPRQRSATEAGLKSLERMGITSIPLLASEYPRRLRDLPEPPLLLYAQGAWPPPAPIVALHSPGPLTDEPAADAGTLLLALGNLGVSTAAGSDHLELLSPNRSLAVLPFGLLLARSRVPDPLRGAATAGAATLLSITPVNAAATPSAEELARDVLIALADGLLVVGDALPAHALSRAELHCWTLGGDTPGPSPRSAKRLRPGEAGAQLIARALGLRGSGDTTVQQEHLW